MIGAILLATIVLAAGVVYSHHRGSPTHRAVVPVPTVAPNVAPDHTHTPSGESCSMIGIDRLAPSAITALVVEGAPIAPGSTSERCDHQAFLGSWSSVIRRVDGSLGLHSAIVTFPALDPTTKQPGKTVWKIADGYAQIRSDLSPAETATIIAGTTIVNGRPVLPSPPHFTVALLEPYRPLAIHEIRYPTHDAGELPTLGDGTVYTGITTNGEFEDRLFQADANRQLLVNGQPAVMSSIYGGNGTLAWEPAPGLIAYIGFSATTRPAGNVTQALVRIATHTTTMTISAWQATDPVSDDATN